MTAALLETVVSWRTLVLVLVVYGFAPGFFLRLIVLAYPRSNARRAELVAELYAVPRVQRPQWVLEQLEIALFEGLPDRISAALCRVSHRRRNPAAVDDETVRRRKLVAQGAAIMFGTAITGAGSWPTPSQISMADVEQMEAVIKAMRTLDYQVDRVPYRSVVVDQLCWAQRLLSASCKDEVRQRLLRVLADLQNLAGTDRSDDER